VCRVFLYISIIWAVTFIGGNPVFSQGSPEKGVSKKKSLTEILEEEKANKYLKIDQFLEDFDKGFSWSTGEKFEDLLEEREFIEADDEITTDSFETFNEEFDKIIEEDLADFELFEIDTNDLERDLLTKKSKAAPKGEATRDPNL